VTLPLPFTRTPTSTSPTVGLARRDTPQSEDNAGAEADAEEEHKVDEVDEEEEEEDKEEHEELEEDEGLGGARLFVVREAITWSRTPRTNLVTDCLSLLSLWPARPL